MSIPTQIIICPLFNDPQYPWGTLAQPEYSRPRYWSYLKQSANELLLVQGNLVPRLMAPLPPRRHPLPKTVEPECIHRSAVSVFSCAQTWRGGQYIDSRDVLVIRITFVLGQVKDVAIPTDKVAQDIGEKTEKVGLLFRESHAERAGLVEDNLFWVTNSLAIFGAVQGNVTKVGIRKLGIIQIECCVPCVENKGLLRIS